ncbi:MAG TPA: aspartate aminotransferase family protein [Candidatus Hydrogenedens sp.]|nr:aspartate aminotransferase family protein [Candidatus Hydrogenedens sp.]HOL19432.1 aspartate aminotransferase family protein [Candidatus Hydrogenedens sp.]
MTNDELRTLADTYLINTYGSRTLALVRGQGTHVWDADGKEYIDLFSGIAVCNLGHCHPKVTKAIVDQAQKLIHVSNLYNIEPQILLAKKLSDLCFAKKWFFCNGGAEANESAIKIARRYWTVKGLYKPNIITAEQSFHGRTLATITATGQPKYHKGFEPMVPGFTYVPYNDTEAIEKALSPATGAILLEPIQGEGGIRMPSPNYLKEVREICNKHQVLLIFDEVQTGLGRTGYMFAHQAFDVTPDIMTLAKGLANGVPIGAMGCTEEIAQGFSPGAHACTFGGNPLSTATALAVVEELSNPTFLENVRALGKCFITGLSKIAEVHRKIKEVRGQGLMIGVEFDEPVNPLINQMFSRGFICGSAGPHVLRFLPPLIVEQQELTQALHALEQSLGELGW